MKKRELENPKKVHPTKRNRIESNQNQSGNKNTMEFHSKRARKEVEL